MCQTAITICSGLSHPTGWAELPSENLSQHIFSRAEKPSEDINNHKNFFKYIFGGIFYLTIEIFDELERFDKEMGGTYLQLCQINLGRKKKFVTEMSVNIIFLLSC